MISEEVEIKDVPEISEHAANNNQNCQETKTRNEENRTSVKESSAIQNTLNTNISGFQQLEVLSKLQELRINSMLTNLLNSIYKIRVICGSDMAINGSSNFEEILIIANTYISDIKSAVENLVTKCQEFELYQAETNQKILDYEKELNECRLLISQNQTQLQEFIVGVENEKKNFEKRIKNLKKKNNKIKDAVLASIPVPLPDLIDNEFVTAVENWSYSQVNLSKINYVWTIRNFDFREITKEYIKSPMFSSDSNATNWCLVLYPKGQEEYSKNYMSLFLFLNSSNKAVVDAEFKIAILDYNRIKRNLCETTHKFILKEGRGWPQFIEREYVLKKSSGLLPNNKFTISCEILIRGDCDHVSGQVNLAQLKIPECKLSQHIGILLEDQKLTDVVLRVGSREFKAHKAILAARSSVFAAMFENDMKEKLLNEVKIEDCTEDVFKEVLRFIYTGKVVDLTPNADGLLAAAEKYDLQRLKIICEEVMIRNLSVPNVTNFLILADLFQAKLLKPFSIRFINSHMTEVVNTSTWKNIFSYPNLAAEVFYDLALRHIPSSTPKPIKNQNFGS